MDGPLPLAGPPAIALGIDAEYLGLGLLAAPRLVPNPAAKTPAVAAVEQWIDFGLIQESMLPLVISTLGLVSTGALFDTVQHWPAFVTLTELFIVVPTMFNVKGNIELSLSSRLSTAANLGTLDRETIKTNLRALLLQAMSCGLAVGLASILLGSMVHRRMNSVANELALLNSCVLTCTASSLLVGGLSAAILGTCRQHALADPDNIAAPFTASIGDLTALALLSLVASTLFWARSAAFQAALLAAILVLYAAAVHCALASRAAAKIARDSVPALVLSLSLTSTAGIVLERFSASMPSLAFLLPVLAGTCNNFSSIFASRLSTSLLDPCPEGIVRDRRTILSMALLNIVLQAIVALVVTHYRLAHFASALHVIAVCFGTSSINLVLMLGLVRPLAKFLHRRSLDLHSNLIPVASALGDCLGAVHLIFVLKALAAK